MSDAPETPEAPAPEPSETAPKKAGDRRISTPVVLAASSAMLAIGLVGLFASGGGTGGSGGASEDPPNEYVALTIDDRTPRRVAESYLDAWRRRAWDQAASISVDDAHARALEKRALDDEVDPVDRVMARDVWERLAGAPLSIEWGDSSREGTDFVLEGVASYDFMNDPYRRRMRWVIRQEGELFRVVRMEHGEVLTEIPEVLRGTEL